MMPHRFYVRRRMRNVLDTTISVGSLIKWIGIILLLLLAFSIIFGIPYYLGRQSVDCTEQQTTKETTQKAEAKTPTKESQQAPETKEEIKKETKTTVEEDASDSSADADSSEVALSYKDVEAVYGGIDFDQRGDDWGTVNSVTLTLTNGENGIVDIEKVALKIYAIGKTAPEFEEFDVDLAPIQKGITVTKALPVHYSTTGIDEEKNIIIELRDAQGKRIAEITEGISLQ